VSDTFLGRLDRDLRLAVFWRLLGVAGAAHVIQLMAQQQARAGSFLHHPERWQQVVPLGFGATPSAVAIGLHLALLAASLALAWTGRPALGALWLGPVALLGAFVQPVTISNHYLVFLLALGSLPAVLLLARPGRGAAPARVDACARLAAGGYARALRHVFVITYFFAGFHKLNTGWFDLAGNAATRLARAQLVPLLEPVGLALPWLVDLALLPILIFPVAAELAIPALLLVPRLRPFGALLGIALHLPMFAREVLDYPTLILAFYVLFFPEPEVRRFGAALRRASPGRVALAGLGAGAVLLVWLVLVPATPARPGDPTWWLEVVAGAALISFFAWVGVTLAWQIAGALWPPSGSRTPGATRPSSA